MLDTHSVLHVSPSVSGRLLSPLSECDCRSISGLLVTEVGLSMITLALSLVVVEVGAYVGNSRA